MDIRTLQQQNKKLKKILDTVISEAKLNKDVLRRFIDFEVRILGCSKLSELINLLIFDFKSTFKLTVVGLYLLDKDDLASPLLTALEAKTLRQLTLLKESQSLNAMYPDKKIRAGDINRDLKKQLFPDNPFVLSSVLLPLINKGKVIGSLHLGARELNRYHSEYRYDYLERMSALVALCIENCIIRENLDYLSNTDKLTKIYNRHSFDLEIEKALQRANRQKQHLSLLFLDIDHFKKVNDQYGHPAGDAILKSFAHILKSQIRNTDFLARFGGEEFVILLPDCKPRQAEQIANNLRLKVSEHLFDTKTVGTISVTTSIGVSCYAFDNLIAENFTDLAHILLQTSDQALYRAKQAGRNKVLFKAMPRSVSIAAH